ncbi:hypothetical protein HU200_056656 [Digitaria exilis]|uniref:Uncharacterized protein n=1 Tax=Digitaria exilis TaxID=1010633 RepID=A0A835AC72_9POAL|nr:hypothetical protein HU200_056656 [Digitaria exilis]
MGPGSRQRLSAKPCAEAPRLLLPVWAPWALCRKPGTWLSANLEFFAESLARASRQTQLRAPQRRRNAVFAERLHALGKYLRCTRQRLCRDPDRKLSAKEASPRKSLPSQLCREPALGKAFAERMVPFAESARLTAKSLDPVLDSGVVVVEVQRTQAACSAGDPGSPDAPPHVPGVLLYRRNESMAGRDPVAVIQDAVARALVHYYPLAGRLREVEGGKLAVDCTGEGVLFIEADADIHLEQLGEPLLPPFPCLHELLFDVPGSSAIIDAPLMLFQVTRLACGGFIILAVRMNHTMADGARHGALARGARAPTVKPVWNRELLMARDPPRPSFAHREYDDTVTSLDDLAHRCFFFTPPDHVRRPGGVPVEVPQAALAPAADVEMRMMCAVNDRGIIRGAAGGGGIPRSYYGNAAVCSVAVSGALCANPVSYAVELVKQAKEKLNMEYIRSVADLVVLRGRPPLSFKRTYVVSDVRKAPAAHLDFGWGRPVRRPRTNDRGEELGIAVPVCLPRPAMQRFAEEMGKLLQRPLVDVAVRQRPRSAL